MGAEVLFDKKNIESGLTEIKEAQDTMGQALTDVQNAVKGKLSDADFKSRMDKISETYSEKFEAIDKLVKDIDQMKAGMNAQAFVDGTKGKEERKRNLESFTDFWKATGEFEHFAGGKHAIQLNQKNSYADRDGIHVKASPLATDTGTHGGYLAILAELSNEVNKDLPLITPFERESTVKTINGNIWQEPYRVKGVQDPSGAQQRETRSLTDTPEFKMAEGKLYPSYFYPAITNEMIFAETIVDPETFLREELAEQESEWVQREYLVGDGSHGPIGILTQGGRASEIVDIKTGVADNLWVNYKDTFKLIGAIKSAYMNKKLYANLTTITENLWTYTDNNGNFYIKDANPFVWRGYPIVEFPDMPDVAPGSYPLLFGDLKAAYRCLKNGWIKIVRDETTQKGFVIYYVEKYFGGIVRRPEAVTRAVVGV